MTGKPLDALTIEQVRGIGDRGAQALIGTAAQIKGEIKLGGIAPGGQGLHRKAIQSLQARLGQLNQLQHHLHQRVPARIALDVQRLHHLLKRQLLVVIGRD